MFPALMKLVAAVALALGAVVLAVAAQQGGKPPDSQKASPGPVAALPVKRKQEKPAVDRHGLAEPDAFAFVQRTAMQTRARMRDVANTLGRASHPGQA